LVGRVRIGRKIEPARENEANEQAEKKKNEEKWQDAPPATRFDGDDVVGAVAGIVDSGRC